jgi:hypothetical protein
MNFVEAIFLLLLTYIIPYPTLLFTGALFRIPQGG